jgi:hypothetical protein
MDIPYLAQEEFDELSEFVAKQMQRRHLERRWVKDEHGRIYCRWVIVEPEEAYPQAAPTPQEQFLTLADWYSRGLVG